MADNLAPTPKQPRDEWPELLDREMPKFFEPAYAIDDFWTDDEVQEAAMLMFHTFSRYRHYKGGTFKFEKFDNYKMWKLLYPKLKTIMPWLREDDILDGNGYITGTNYALHMDSCNPSVYLNCDQIAIKSFIMPIFTCQPNNAEHDSSFVLFKNRLLGWECNFSNGGSNDVKLAYQQNVISYDNLPWLDVNGEPMDLDTSKLHSSVEDIYKEQLKHLPEETYYGMELEAILPYKAGGIIVFDPYQPHVTGNKDYSKTRLKGGIRFNIQRKINNL